MHGLRRLSTRTRRLGAGWLAVVLLLASLQPLMAQAWRQWGGGSGDWVQVCTSAGMRWVTLQAPADRAAPAAGVQPAGHGDPAGISGPDHCPWCRTGLHLPTLPGIETLQFAVAAPAASPPPPVPARLGRVGPPARHVLALVRAPPGSAA